MNSSAAPSRLSEGSCIDQLDRLLASLPDDEARARVVAWVQRKYGCDTAPAHLTAKPAIDWAKVLRDGFPPIVPDNLTPLEPVGPTWPHRGWRDQTVLMGEARKCAFDGLPPGTYHLTCFCPKCSPMCGPQFDASGNNILLVDLAVNWTDADRLRFTQGSGAIPTGTAWTGTSSLSGNTIP